jgi:hypothetical protein
MGRRVLYPRGVAGSGIRERETMVRLIKSLTNSAEYSIKDIAQERASCPILIFNRICYGYMNGDWIMVISNVAILALTIGFLAVSMTSNKPISA